jgi:sigma-B regulation protein RsbU (phosphoserine phosphatase)
MALTRAYMRSFAGLGMDVGEVLRRANSAIIGDVEENRYVTMLLVRLDASRGRMTYASAGHLPGVLLRGAGGIDRIMDSTGVPLGLFADATFATHEIRFETQDILVLGTDGATETSDGFGVEFGRHRVIEYVRTHAADTAREIAAGVYGAARSFGVAEPQHDDITSVIVKVTGPLPPGSRRDANAFLQSVDESAA